MDKVRGATHMTKVFVKGTILFLQCSRVMREATCCTPHYSGDTPHHFIGCMGYIKI